MFRTPPPWVTANIYSSISSSRAPDCFSYLLSCASTIQTLFFGCHYIYSYLFYLLRRCFFGLINILIYSSYVSISLDAVSHSSYTATLGYSFFASGTKLKFSFPALGNKIRAQREADT